MLGETVKLAVQQREALIDCGAVGLVGALDQGIDVGVHTASIGVRSGETRCLASATTIRAGATIATWRRCNGVSGFASAFR